MKYYTSKTISATFEDAVKLVTEKLKTEGFGVISEIRMHEKLKEKLDVNFKKYTILGACNPTFAYMALQMEDKIGAMLPCNILVIEQGKDKIEVATINPLVSMQSIENNNLHDVAKIVSESLNRVLEQI